MVIEAKRGKNFGIGDSRRLRGIAENYSPKVCGLVALESLGDRIERNFGRETYKSGTPHIRSFKYSLWTIT